MSIQSKRKPDRRQRLLKAEDNKYRRFPTCPYCFHEHTDSLDGVLIWNYDGDDADITCEKCGETFHCFVRYTELGVPPTYISYYLSDLNKVRKGLSNVVELMTELQDRPQKAREVALQECERLLSLEMFWED